MNKRKKTETISNALIQLMDRSVVANGFNTNLKKTMDNARLALKNKLNNFKKQTNTIINCSIAKGLVNKKI